MLTRRAFGACALCAISGFLASDAQAQAPGFKRTILSQTDGPIDGYTTLVVAVDIDPGATIPRHTHPGIESSYVVEGATELSVDGQAARTLKPGEAFQVAAGIPHSAKNGDAKTRVIATYVVEKGKPLASPA